MHSQLKVTLVAERAFRRAKAETQNLSAAKSQTIYDLARAYSQSHCSALRSSLFDPLSGHVTRELSTISGIGGEVDPDIGLIAPVWLDRSSRFCSGSIVDDAF